MTVAVRPLLLGWMTSARSGFLEGETGAIRYPVLGFLCESYATAGARDITALGGWRAYLKSVS